MSRKRRPFQLIEVMVAMMLLLTCLVPLVRSHGKLYEANCRYLDGLHLERIVDLTCADFVQGLYKRSFPLSYLFDGEVHSLEKPFSTPDISRPFTVNQEAIPYRISYSSRPAYQKESSERSIYLLDVILTFTPERARLQERKVKFQVVLEVEGGGVAS